jgi:hypothetical protein
VGVAPADASNRSHVEALHLILEKGGSWSRSSNSRFMSLREEMGRYLRLWFVEDSLTVVRADKVGFGGRKSETPVGAEIFRGIITKRKLCDVSIGDRRKRKWDIGRSP